MENQSNQIIIKTTVLDREITNQLVTDTKGAWLSELADVQNDNKSDNKETRDLINECKTFINRSVDGDTFDNVTPDGTFGFELRNEYGDIFGRIWSNRSEDYIFGSIWSNLSEDYDCIIETLD